MNSLLKLAGATAFFLFAAAVTAPPSLAQSSAATAADLTGSWAHSTKGTWTFRSNGTGTLVRDSVNGIPGRYTITLEWSVQPDGVLNYTPIRNTLVDSPGYDKDQVIDNPKTFNAPFQIQGGALILGGAEYLRQ